MWGTDNSTSVPVAPAKKTAGAQGFFSDGDDAQGVLGTQVDADWLNMVQAELRAFLTAAGISPSKASDGQVKAACDALYGGAGSNTNPGWRRLPGGTILQWGTGSTTTGTGDTVIFPFTFPNAVFAVQINESNATGWTAGSVSELGVSTLTPSSFRAHSKVFNAGQYNITGGVGYSWMATGF